LTAGVTIDTDETALLMDIRRQFMILDAKWAKVFILCCVRGAIFDVQVVLEPAMEVEADPVAVMA